VDCAARGSDVEKGVQIETVKEEFSTGGDQDGVSRQDMDSLSRRAGF